MKKETGGLPMDLLKKIWNWCCDEDWIVVAIPGVILAIVLAFCGLFYWLALVGVIGGIVVLAEIVALKFTGLSISDQFRTWKKKHRRTSIAVLAAAAATFAALILHLMRNI
jgi:hypothetical protein